MPELDITGFTTHGRPTSCAAAIASSRLSAKRYCEVINPSSLRREVADAVAVHGQLDGLGRRRDLPAFALELGKRRGVDRFDFGNDESGLCFSTAARSALPSSIENTSNPSATCIAGAFA